MGYNPRVSTYGIILTWTLRHGAPQEDYMKLWKAKDWPSGDGLTLAGEYPEGGRWLVVDLELEDIADILELLNQGVETLHMRALAASLDDMAARGKTPAVHIPAIPPAASAGQMVPLEDDGFGDLP